MTNLDILFWWTGCIMWTLVAVLAVAWGLPDGPVYRGVTRLTFYDFGPVLWRVTPESINVFNRLKTNGYHFLPLGGAWSLGLSLPTWLSRRLYARTTQREKS